MSPPEEYSDEELIIAVLARQLRSENVVLTGLASMIPILSVLLARQTRAEDLTWISGAVGVDPEIEQLNTGFTMQPALWNGSSAYLRQLDHFWPLAQQQRMDTFMVSGGQVDQYGNVNSSLIGEYEERKVCLMGSAGMGDMGALGPRILIWLPRHTPRTLVERVDFISCPGYYEGPGEREERGLEGGPQLLVSNLGVFDFDPGSRRLRAQYLHHGVSMETVQKQTGFEVLIPDSVTTTKRPTEEELEIIRECDPNGMRRRPGT